MGEELVLQIENLHNQYGDHVVHDKLKMSARRGEITGLVGSSGSGKTVLLRTVLGLHRPTSGVISLFGRDTSKFSEAQERAMRRRWGVLFQNGALFSALTVAENIGVPLREYYNLSPRLCEEIARYKISMVGLSQHAASKYPSELSGGMRKRAALARALALDPELLFLDEPTAGLDPIGADAFDDLILYLRQVLDLSVILITHDLDTLYKICDRVSVLAEKRMIVTAPPEDLARNSYPWIQNYFNGPRGGLRAQAAQAT